MSGGAAALAVRLPVARASKGQTVASGLAFDQSGGPVVAVCGLVGGSGATTLAFALAKQAASESRAPVLVAEADARAGGLALLARHASPLSLAELANAVHDARPFGQPFIEIEPGLRLVGSGPRLNPDPDPGALSPLLAQAREAHGLVVLDCGSTWPATPSLLASATHLVWTMPATPAALERAEAVWTGPLAPAAGRRPEALVCGAMTRRRLATVRALHRLAALRCDRLVMTQFDGAASGRSSDLAGALRALAPLFRRGAA